MSASAELQKVIYEALIADAALGTKIGSRVYDRMPEGGSYPCCTFGPVSEIEDGAECISAVEYSVQLDVWSRDNGRLRPCKEIVDAVRKVLHDADLTMADPYALSFIRVSSTRVFLDRDAITAHGVLTVEAAVEGV